MAQRADNAAIAGYNTQPESSRGGQTGYQQQQRRGFGNCVLLCSPLTSEKVNESINIPKVVIAIDVNVALEFRRDSKY